MQFVCRVGTPDGRVLEEVFTASDESACLEPLRSCLRSAFTDAFNAMCQDRVAACEGSSDPRCAELTDRCQNGGPAACSAADAGSSADAG